jgi:hypothetical protein
VILEGPLLAPAVRELITEYCLRKRAPEVPSHVFDVDSFPDHLIKKFCRFEKDDLRRLPHLLRMPDYLEVGWSKVSSLEGLFITLCRLGRASNLIDFPFNFQWSYSMISKIVKRFDEFIDDNWRWILEESNSMLQPVWLERSAELIKRHMRLEHGNVCLFVDGKLYTCCRPAKWQRSIYNGKDRRHGVKFQAVINAFGLFVNFFGPQPGRRHDAELFRESEFERLFTEAIGPRLLVVYGDSAYVANQYMWKPIADVVGGLNAQQTQWNEEWARRRVAVEWSFGKMMSLWKLLSMKEKMRVQLSPVAVQIRVAALMTNLHTLCYPGLIPTYFRCEENDMPLPTLEEYLAHP